MAPSDKGADPCMSTPIKAPSCGAHDEPALECPGAGGVLRSIENTLAPAASPSSAFNTPVIKRQRLDIAEVPERTACARAKAILRAPASGEEAQPLGREKEYEQLCTTLTAFSESGQGVSLYVSGLPGTGKTHTVRKALDAACGARQLDERSVLWVNCMAISSATEVYAQLEAACCVGGSAAAAAPGAQSASFDRVLAVLSASSSSGISSSASRPAKRHRNSSAAAGQTLPRRYVLVLDEMDQLAAKGAQELQHLFSLPHQSGMQVGRPHVCHDVTCLHIIHAARQQAGACMLPATTLLQQTAHLTLSPCRPLPTCRVHIPGAAHRHCQLTGPHRTLPAGSEGV